jgi:glycosyltransferase involved in cell wall biosynthesis
MVNALRMEGIDACIVTTEDNGIYRNKDVSVNQWTQYENIPVLVHSCLDSQIRSIREYLISLSFTYWLVQNIGAYDVIHVHALFSFPSTISMFIARIRGVPYIIRTIGQLNEWSLKQGALKKRTMMRLIESKNLCEAKAIHVTSRYEQKDLEQLGLADKCFVLGLGVEQPNLKNKEYKYRMQERVKFLFLSRIHPKKQIELLFSAFAVLKYEIKEERWELAIAGTGDQSYIDHLKGMSKDLGIEKHLLWHGHVAGEAKHNLFESSDWFVLPSASENFGISVVEAMASALPVIISNNTGISDKVIDYSAGYICTDTPLNLSSTLSKAIRSPNYENMSNSAKRLVAENFSWQHIAKSLTQVYLRVK